MTSVWWPWRSWRRWAGPAAGVAKLHLAADRRCRPVRDRLSGTVEVDETFIGRRRGRRAARRAGRRARSPWSARPSRSGSRGAYGRCRHADPARRLGLAATAFLTRHVEPGATVITDGWMGYHGIAGLGLRPCPGAARAGRARAPRRATLAKPLPGVHRVASLAKRWLLGTHQGSVEDAHLQSYLNEFCFRFNRRRSRSRGLVFYRVLELAVGHDPVRYRHLIAHPKHKAKPPEAPGQRGHPPSIERPRAARPWRTVHLG